MIARVLKIPLVVTGRVLKMPLEEGEGCWKGAEDAFGGGGGVAGRVLKRRWMSCEVPQPRPAHLL